jgi:hypothetical protein
MVHWQRIVLLACLLPAIPGLVACGSLGARYSVPANSRIVVLEYGHQAALKTIEAGVDTGVIKGALAVKAIAIVDMSSLSLNKARDAIMFQDRVSYFMSRADTKVHDLVQFAKEPSPPIYSANPIQNIKELGLLKQ